jgi:hypothetical protein
MYGSKIANLRLGEIIGGDEGAALICELHALGARTRHPPPRPVFPRV